MDQGDSCWRFRTWCSSIGCFEVKLRQRTLSTDVAIPRDLYASVRQETGPLCQNGLRALSVVTESHR
jgi:hypothetical protein